MVKPKYEFTAWVHPGCGDDYSISGSMVLSREYAINDNVVKREIRRILKKENSESLDDFTFKRVN
jgi:hypothetical protein